MRAPKATTLLTVIALVVTACGGTTYVQPEMPTAAVSGPVLPLRALSLSFDRGIASIDAGGVMRFGDVIVGTFAEGGTFTVEGGSVWATMDERGAIRVIVDDPAQAGPSEVMFRVTDDRLFQPDGAVLATIDASGQLVTSSGSFPVTGITSRARRLALFLYLVAATYAEDVPEPGTGETP
jgi:hypothetical protein